MDSSKVGSGRRRLTSEQRQRLVTRFHQSQLTQRDFAARHGIGLSTLGKWLQREGKATLPVVKFQDPAELDFALNRYRVAPVGEPKPPRPVATGAVT